MCACSLFKVFVFLNKKTFGLKKTSIPNGDIVSPTKAVTESVIKVKKAGLKGPNPSSEAEALRKDPLKNYPDTRRVAD